MRKISTRFLRWRGALVLTVAPLSIKGFTAHHDVVEYWDGGSLKVFHGVVTMKFDDPSQKTVKPVMTHFFYMDKTDPTKVSRWVGSMGPTAF